MRLAPEGAPQPRKWGPAGWSKYPQEKQGKSAAPREQSRPPGPRSRATPGLLASKSPGPQSFAGAAAGRLEQGPLSNSGAHGRALRTRSHPQPPGQGIRGPISPAGP